MQAGAEIALILFLILANGAFAMSEIALVSARPARLEHRARAGSRAAARARVLASQPNAFLSTIQIGITFVGTFAGAYGGATIARQLAVALRPVPYVGANAEVVALVVVVGAITYLTLVLGELAPKRIALANPEGIAILAVYPMQILLAVAKPVVGLLGASTNLVLRLVPIRPDSSPPVTEEEIRMMIAHGASAGIVHPREREMLEAIFHFGDRRAVELMTPRNEVLWIDLDAPVEDALEVVRESPSPSLPAFRRRPDGMAGFVQIRDLAGIAPEDIRLEDHVKPAISVPEDFPALRLIDLFRETKSPVALVTDEHNEFTGVVTVMGVLEAIVGDLPQFGEEYEPRIVQRPDGSLLVDGRVPIGELADRLRTPRLASKEGVYVTLGGFVMEALGQMPSIGDSFERSGYRFEVVDMDGFRVDRVLVSEIGGNAGGLS